MMNLWKEIDKQMKTLMILVFSLHVICVDGSQCYIYISYFIYFPFHYSRLLCSLSIFHYHLLFLKYNISFFLPLTYPPHILTKIKEIQTIQNKKNRKLLLGMMSCLKCSPSFLKSKEIYCFLFLSSSSNNELFKFTK
jgi:hypothetical protein